MSVVIATPTPAHGVVTYPKLRVVLDSLQVTIDSIIVGSLGANLAIISSSTGTLTVSTTTSSELAGLHSLTASRAIVTNGSGILTVSATTATELGFVNGVTSAIQSQISARAVTNLSNLVSTAINVGLVPDSDDARSLGATSFHWNDIFASRATITKSFANSTVSVDISNTDSAHVTSSAAANITAGGASAGDPIVKFSISGVSDDWAAGIDNSDDDAFVISNNSTLGTNNYLRLDRNGSAKIVGPLSITTTGLQIVLSTSSSALTINASPQASARTWSIPDISSAGTFAALEGAQTFTGAKTFNADTTVVGDLSTVVWTDYSGTSTITGFSSRSVTELRYKKIGHLVFVSYRIIGTSNSTSFSFTLPYANGGLANTHGAGQSEDNGVFLSTAIGQVGSGSSTLSFFKDAGGGSWTNSGEKRASAQFFYETSS